MLHSRHLFHKYLCVFVFTAPAAFVFFFFPPSPKHNISVEIMGGGQKLTGIMG